MTRLLNGVALAAGIALPLWVRQRKFERGFRLEVTRSLEADARASRQFAEDLQCEYNRWGESLVKEVEKALRSSR